jgi:capsular polysaccharide biosynthesis protein
MAETKAKNNVRKFLTERAKFVLSFAVTIALITALVSLIQTPKYRSSMRLLVVQSYGFGVDPYNIAKATQFFSDLLSEVVTSRTFFDEVLKIEPRISKSFFYKNLEKRDKQWKQMIASRTIGDTGIIAISVYHPDRTQAELIAESISKVLTTEGSLFHGGGDRIGIRVLDAPVTSEKPVQPKTTVNTLVGALVGALLAIGLTFFFPIEGVKVAIKVKEGQFA